MIKWRGKWIAACVDGWVCRWWFVKNEIRVECFRWNAFIENNSMFTVAAFALKEFYKWVIAKTNSKQLKNIANISDESNAKEDRVTQDFKALILSCEACTFGWWWSVFHICQRQTWGRVAYISACLDIKCDMFMCILPETKIHIWPWKKFD